MHLRGWKQTDVTGVPSFMLPAGTHMSAADAPAVEPINNTAPTTTERILLMSRPLIGSTASLRRHFNATRPMAQLFHFGTMGERH